MRLLISAVEASADRLGAELVTALRRRGPVEVRGLVGPALRAVGAEPLPGTGDPLAVMGLQELFAHIGRILANAAALRSALNEKPDVFVPIDAADFHLGLASEARRRGVRTVGYVCPQFWAWRPGRADKLAASFDRLLCLFRFEPEQLVGKGLDAVWVGHPVVDRVAASSREPGTLAIFPGSRRSELRALLPVFLEVAARSGARRVLLPVASTISRADLGVLPAGVETCRPEEALAVAERALTKSGTSSLELAVAGVPMVVAHRVPWLTWLVGRLVVRGVKHLALPNILLDGPVVAERVQWFDSGELTDLLRSAAPPPAARLLEVLGPPGVAERAAAAVWAP